MHYRVASRFDVYREDDLCVVVNGSSRIPQYVCMSAKYYEDIAQLFSLRGHLIERKDCRVPPKILALFCSAGIFMRCNGDGHVSSKSVNTQTSRLGMRKVFIAYDGWDWWDIALRLRTQFYGIKQATIVFQGVDPLSRIDDIMKIKTWIDSNMVHQSLKLKCYNIVIETPLSLDAPIETEALRTTQISLRYVDRTLSSPAKEVLNENGDSAEVRLKRWAYEGLRIPVIIELSSPFESNLAHRYQELDRLNRGAGIHLRICDELMPFLPLSLACLPDANLISAELEKIYRDRFLLLKQCDPYRWFEDSTECDYFAAPDMGESHWESVYFLENGVEDNVWGHTGRTLKLIDNGIVENQAVCSHQNGCEAGAWLRHCPSLRCHTKTYFDAWSGEEVMHRWAWCWRAYRDAFRTQALERGRCALLQASQARDNRRRIIVDKNIRVLDVAMYASREYSPALQEGIEKGQRAWLEGRGTGNIRPVRYPVAKDERYMAARRGEDCVNYESIPRFSPITSLDLDITKSCDLQCRYCFKGKLVRRPEKSMSIECALSAIDWILHASQETEHLYVNFMGGEPILMFGRIKSIVPYGFRRAGEMGKRIQFSATTNMTHVTEEVTSFWASWGMGWHSSIDGSPRVQDWQRPRAGGEKSSPLVEKAAKWILLHRPTCMARATVTQETVDFMEESFEYFLSLGYVTMGFAIGDVWSWREESVFKYCRQMKRIGDRLKELYLNNRFVLFGNLDGIFRAICKKEKGLEECNSFSCGAGRGMAMVDSGGDLWPCHRWDGAAHEASFELDWWLGNIFEGWFNDDLHLALLQRDVSTARHEKCVGCPITHLCDGGCAAENLQEVNTIYRMHPYWCNLVQRCYEVGEQLYSEMREMNIPMFDEMYPQTEDWSKGRSVYYSRTSSG